MKKLILIVLMFATLGAYAQTQPSLPMGSVVYGNTYYLDPDGNVWAGSAAKKYRIVAQKGYVDSINALGWSNAQVDSAISSKVAGYVPLTQKGAADGVATLDGSTKIPISQIPDALVGSVNYQGNYNASTNTPTLPSSPSSSTKGHYYVVATGGTQFGETFVAGDWIISNGSAWQKVDNNNAVTSVAGKVGAVTLNVSDVNGALAAGDNVSLLTNDAGYITSADIPAPPVTSVNSKTGAVVINASDVGLGNVDNTSDADKPISAATQTALNGKENAFSKNTAFNKNFGSGSGTVAQGNDSRINNGQTAFGWGNHADYGYWVNFPSGDWGSAGTSGKFRTIASTTGSPIGAVSFGAFFPHELSGYGFYLSGRNDDYFLRSIENGSLTPWREIWHTGNFNPNNYVPLTGGTISPSSASDPSNTPGGIQFRQSGTLSPVSGPLIQGYDYNGNDAFYMRTYAVSDIQLSLLLGGMSAAGKVTAPTLEATSSIIAPTFTRTTTGLVPTPGGAGSTRFLREDGSWVVPDGGGGGGTATDLSLGTRTSTTMVVNSSTGTGVTLPISTTTYSGLQSAADKTKLNGLTNYSSGSGINISSGTISANFGTSSGTIAQGNDSRINNGQTAYSWGDHAGKYVSRYGRLAGVDLNTITDSRIMGVSDDNSNRPYAYGTLISASNNDTGLQIYGGFTSDELRFRGWSSSGANFTPWRRVWSDGDFGQSSVNNWNAAYSWGNHASAGYALSGTGLTQVRNNSQLDSRYLQSSDLSGYVPTSRIINIAAGSGITMEGVSQDLSNNVFFRVTNASPNATHTGDVTGSGALTIATSAVTYAKFQNVPTQTLLGRGASGTGNIGAVTLGAGLSLSASNVLNTNYGTSSGTVAAGNDSRINNGQTAYSWGNHASAGYSVNGTGSSQVRTNSQLDARYLQSVSGGSGISVSGGSTVAVDGTVVRTSGTQTVGGSKTFSSPVTGVDGTANNHFVTKQQVPALASQGTGAVRLVEAPIAGLFSGGSDNYLKFGTASNTYSYTIPAGTFSGANGMFRITLTGDYTASSATSRNFMIEFSQGATTVQGLLIASKTTSPYSETFTTTITGTSRSSGIFYTSKTTLRNGGGTSVSGEAISGIDFRNAVTIKFLTSSSDMSVNVIPLTIEVADLN